jgi:hypothetical protein
LDGQEHLVFDSPPALFAKNGRKCMSIKIKPSTVVLALAACLATSISVLAEDTPARVRGTLQKMDGNTLTIAMKSGKETNVPLKDGAPVIAVTKGACPT